MTDKNLEQFIKSAKKIRLDKDDKSQIQSFLRAFIFEHPVRSTYGFRHREYNWSNSSIINRLALSNVFSFTMLSKPMPIILLIAILVGSGTSIAAEHTLPNDLLYPIKIGINEEVRGWFAVSSEAEAEWQATLMERRLEESEELAVKGRLDSEVSAKLESNFQKHAEKVQKRIAEIKSKDNIEAGADISSRLESSLKAHAKIIARIDAEEDDFEVEIRPLIIKVKTQANKAAQARADFENMLSVSSSGHKSESNTRSSINVEAEVKTAAEGKLNSAQNKINEVKRFLDKMKKVISAEILAQAEAKIKLAEDAIAEGRAKLEAKAYGEAFALFQKAHRIAQEAKLLLEARKKLNIDLEINGESGNEDEVESDTEINTNISPNHESIKSREGLKVKLNI